MRAVQLTNKSRPGGRPRQNKAPSNPFRAWLKSCGKTPEQVAKALGVGVSSIYNAANNYYKPGRDLACKIEELTGGVVPVGVWKGVKARKRKAA